MAVDYDPVKAHEYYEKHKKLSGKRRTTKGWSQTRKEQWEYAKDQLSAEHKEIKQGITDNAKSKRQEISDYTKEVVSKLREKYKSMPKEQRAVWKDRINTLIDDLRADASNKKAIISENASTQRTQENEEYEQRKDQAYDTINAMSDSDRKAKKKKKKR